MSKVLQLNVANCWECPFFNITLLQCRNAQKLINGGKRPKEDIPIPKWCPLPDGNDMQYFVVRKELEEISDDRATDKISVTTVQLGNETWLLNSYEKGQEGATLVDNVNHVEYKLPGRGHFADRPKQIAIILGRVVTEDEVDLDRGNLKRGKK